MKNKLTYVIILSIFTSIFLSPALAQTPPEEGTGYNHFYIITQGDVAETAFVENEGTLTVQDTMWYVIPVNITKVYLHVPAGGLLTEFYDLHGQYNDSAVNITEYPNWYSWEFSNTANRSLVNATEIGLTSTYSFTASDNSPYYSFEKQMMYDIDNTNIFVYLDSGYTIQSTNITWINTEDIDPAMLNQFGKPGKVLTIGEIHQGATFTFSIVEDENASNSNNLFYYVLLFVIVTLVGILFLMKKVRFSKEVVESEQEDDEEETLEEESEPVDDIEIDDEMREELLARKKNILKAIKRLDNDLEEGLLTEDVHADLKGKYKEEAVRILKRLD